MSIHPWKRLFQLYLEARRAAGFSNGTLEATARWLNKFLTWCGGQALHNPAQVTAADVERYRQFLLCEPGKHARFYTLHSVDQALRVLRQFFHWAAERRHLLLSPTENLVLPRIETRTPHINVDQVQQLLDAALGQGRPTGLRDRAVLETLYRTGLRRHEFLRLEVSDLDLQAGTLRVVGRSEERQVPVDEALAQTLQHYLHDCRPQFAARVAHAALFLTANGTPYTAGCLAEMLKRLSQRIGFRVTSHMLRHASATHMIERGTEPEEVQRILGLRTRHRIARYTDVATAALQRKAQLPRQHGRSLTHFSSLVEPEEATHDAT